MKRFTVSTYWDKRVMHPKTLVSRILLTVNLNRQQFRVSLKLYATKAVYDKALSSARIVSEDVRQLRMDIAAYVSKAERVLERLSSPTKEGFLRLFKSELDFSVSTKTDVYAYCALQRDQLLKENRFGAAHNLRYAWYSFRSYRSKLHFEDITAEFLTGYKAYMLNKGASQTTIGIYIGVLRGLYSQLQKQGILSDSLNPFKGVVTRLGIKSKDVLYPEQIKALFNYQPNGVREARAKAFFFFCYLSNGMNFRDVANLKFKNIKGDCFYFLRQKTLTTKKVLKEIKVYIHPEVWKILEEFGEKDKRPDKHLFPMFNNCRDEKHFVYTVYLYKRAANKSLHKIGEKLGFEVRINLGIARHCFATAHKLQGTPVTHISEAMGHSSILVTQHYLKGLPDDSLKEMSAKLL